jgi:hypothetical protein
MTEGLAACFAGLADPRETRETRRCDHQLIDILVIGVCAVIAMRLKPGLVSTLAFPR